MQNWELNAADVFLLLDIKNLLARNGKVQTVALEGMISGCLACSVFAGAQLLA